MTDLATPTLDIDQIEVVDDFNPRSRFDEDSLSQLAGTIGEDGVVQPLTVQATKGGKFALVAGERRLKAARLAGLDRLPVHVREGDPLVAAIIENFHREDLDPIDTAKAFQALAEKFNFTTHKEIAKKLNIDDVAVVSRHLKLLKLPAGVQSYIAEGSVPIGAERQLRDLASVSPRIAECVCELAKRSKVGRAEFRSKLPEILEGVPTAKFDDPPTMISPSGFRLGDVIADPAKRRDLGDRHLAALPHTHTDNPELRFEDAEIDAARAAGCLVELKVDHGEWSSTLAYVTDLELAADLAEQRVERIVKRAAEQRKRDEEWNARRLGQDPDQTPAEKSEQRKAAIRERKELSAAARIANRTTGDNLLKQRGTASRKRMALNRAKALAVVVIGDNPNLAARGVRLVSPQLQDVEFTRLKTTGVTREKVSYADPDHATAYVLERIAKAKTPEEVLEVMGETMVASILADENELPQAKRVHGGFGGDAEVQKLLVGDIKAVRPKARRAKKAK